MWFHWQEWSCSDRYTLVYVRTALCYIHHEFHVCIFTGGYDVIKNFWDLDRKETHIMTRFLAAQVLLSAPIKYSYYLNPNNPIFVCFISVEYHICWHSLLSHRYDQAPAYDASRGKKGLFRNCRLFPNGDQRRRRSEGSLPRTVG